MILRRKIRNTSFAILAMVLGASGSVTAIGEEKIDFNRDIRPLLSNRCNACHGPDEEERKADLRLDTRDGALMDLGGYAALKPGDPEASELFYRITTDDEDDLMPPPKKGARFTEAEIDLIRRWIEQGGEYDEHWSYTKPQRPELPEVSDRTWSSHPVDQFVLRRLEEEGLTPSPRADRYSLARRLSLDLTGLPPTWAEAKAFAEDKSENAVATYVDQLLAKAAFGERWARVWLDLARYADSAGYADDPPRTIWAFRDYVIRALNENKPFDQFTIEQIAGDLLENPTDDQLIATAFHRNTLTNNEGGTNDEEFRNVAVVDRVNTTMAVWMGTTMNCAQCHTHKYDPLTHLEYFQLFDFFNQSADADRKDEAPLHEIWTEEQREREKKLETDITSLKKTLTTVTPEIETAFAAWSDRWKQPFSWQETTASAVEAKSVSLSVDESGWIGAVGEAASDHYQVEYSLDDRAGKPITGIRLRVSPEQKQNFVLSRVSATFEPNQEKPGVEGRFVRVELPGKTKTLQVAELEIFSGGKNVARDGKATESSVYASAIGERAIDGNTSGDYHDETVFHSMHQDNPWLEIDLGAPTSIDRIRIWNRMDGGENIQNRIEGFRIVILDEKRKEVFSDSPGLIPRPSHEIAISGIRTLPFAFAAATFEQKGFTAASTIAEKVDPAKGWAIAGGTGKAQELVLVWKEPLAEAEGTIRLELEQSSKYEKHLLRNFRIDFTSEGRLREWARIPADVRAALAKADRSEKEEKTARDYYLSIAPSLADERKQLASLEKQKAGLKPLTTVPIMADLPADKHRKTNIHLRGSYLSHGEEATAGVPAIFHDLPEGMPKNRLALAKWLVDDENPLTPRVLANRFWEQLFGIGIVETSEEFGAQGELPSHPELLDWLAIELRDGGWNMKEFLKLLVTSETYLQSSKVSDEMRAEDPFNRLLARGPRFRISAEMVRDQALAVSGLLSDKMYGAPVKPPQPELGLKAAFGSKTDWETSKGEDRYRRGLYTMWRRSSPYPSMATFDAPNREVCTVRRSRTNTPLQALVTMNDPVYVEAAQAWGRLASSSEGALKDQLRTRLRETLVREQNDHEIERLAQLFEEAKRDYAANPEAAKLMAEDPIGPVPEGSDTASLAAWTVVGNVVLNLDELFLKR